MSFDLTFTSKLNNFMTEVKSVVTFCFTACMTPDGYDTKRRVITVKGGYHMVVTSIQCIHVFEADIPMGSTLSAMIL